MSRGCQELLYALTIVSCVLTADDSLSFSTKVALLILGGDCSLVYHYRSRVLQATRTTTAKKLNILECMRNVEGLAGSSTGLTSSKTQHDSSSRLIGCFVHEDTYLEAEQACKWCGLHFAKGRAQYRHVMRTARINSLR